MANFFAELKRRHIYRVGAAYAVVGWVLLQLVSILMPVFDLPPWIGRAFILLLVLGFPIALIFAWVHEIASSPNGVAPGRATRGKVGWVMAGGLAVVIALVSYEQLATSRGERAVPVPPAGVETTRAAAAPVPAGVSIAVLSFDNLSGDTAQEFFSDGMTEEITTALAKVPDLRVVGRTSAYQFKGKSLDLRAIGQALSVTHLIEGSVRKAGDRVRITAQLIKVDDGTHIWAENYDRQLTDIFAIQEDIAQAIAGALRLPLGLGPGKNLVSSRSIEPELYQQYLHVRAVFRARSGPPEIENLEQVVARDPGYAPAWVLLARLYGGQNPDKQEKAIREALRLDPRNAMAYTVLAGIQDRLGNYAAAIDLQNQALALDPDDPDVLDTISSGLAFRGRVKDAVSMREKLRTLEPFVPVYNYITASILMNNGQSQTAIAILKELPAGPAGGGEGARGVTLARAYAMEGRYGEAADTLLAIPQGQTGQTQQRRQSIEEAARFLRNAPTKVSMPDALPAWDGELSFVYVYVGAPDRVLEAAIRGLNPPTYRYLWSSELAPVRKTERFKAFVRKNGYVERWRVYGWPDSPAIPSAPTISRASKNPVIARPLILRGLE